MGKLAPYIFGTLPNASLWRVLGSLLFILAASYLGLAVYLYFFQSRLVYFPTATLVGSPADLGLAYQDVWLNPDKGKGFVHAWAAPADPSFDSGRWVLFCHGNGGNISGRLPLLEILHRLGYSTLIFDYRGFGRSSGRPTERNTYQDAVAAWRWLVEEQAVAPEDIMVFGRSLGGAVAAWLAREKNPGLLVVESTFTSLVDMGRQLYPFLPVHWLARHRYPTQRHIASYPGPILIMHSQDDELVPMEMGRQLYKTATGDKLFIELRGGHNEVWYVMGREYEQRLRQGVEQLWPQPEPVAGDER